MDNFNGGCLLGVNGMSRGSQIFFIWVGSVHLGGKPYRFGGSGPLAGSVLCPMFHCTSEFNRHRQTDTDI